LLTKGALCLALGACASARPDRLAVCDGQHRRPANPNGSVLTVAMPAAAPSPAAEPPAHPARPIRGAALQASFRPCGGGA
jgi:hypothetical protein